MVCVGTPGQADGTLDLAQLDAAAEALGVALRDRAFTRAPLLIAVRSTVLPGTMTTRFLPKLQAAAGEPPGRRYEVVYNPEFMREGSALADFRAPSRVVMGGNPDAMGPLLHLYKDVDAPRFVTSFEIAEAIKFADNSFHALKVAFANEIGRFALAHGVGAGELLDLFRADTKLNLSDKYLTPGMGFGGPCLPKDVAALVADMRQHRVDAPLLSHLMDSNARHEDFHFARIAAKVSPGARLLLVGLTFKAQSADLRGSPLLALAERLIGAGYDLAVHDPAVGSGEALPAHLRARLMGGLDPVGQWDLVVLGKPLVEEAALAPDTPRLELHRL
jgi:GDP-mannose 6-dehydrogenase